MRRFSTFFFAAVILASAANIVPAHAQSGAEANAWATWCQRQGGTVHVTTSNPICEPGPVDASSSYTADQQAMLNLAGQFGSALGTAIRQGFQRAAERRQRMDMQQAWEEERARIQSALFFEQQRIRNEELIANMHATIGASELGRTQLGTETLRLRTTDQMFNRGGEQRETVTQEVPISAPPVNLAEMQAAQTAYFDALDDANEADAAVADKEAYIENLRTFLEEGLQQRGEESILLAAMPANDPGHAAAEARVAHLDSIIAEVRENDVESVQRLAELRADAARAHEALRAAQQQQARFTPAAPTPSEPRAN